jgi:3-carboxy-cis,cis-muconate cycloisomerase
VSAGLFDRFLSTPEIVEVFSERAVVQHMLDFEAALARAQAAEGVIPAVAAPVIAEACRVEQVDLDAIVAAGSVAGTLAIPLVKQLTAAVAVRDAQAAGYVHWGSTSQDVIDTAMVLATQRALSLIDTRLSALTNALLQLEHTHGDVPMLGRTLLQPALVISVGFKLVAWAAPLVRSRERLRAAARAALKLQLGGAVGSLSAMGDRGAAVAQRMAADLRLAPAPGAWHAQRDEWVALGCEIGVLCGTLGKIAKDISLLAQGEVAEVAEPSGGANGQPRGGSSAMPHKRNPVASMIALAASMRAPYRVAALLAAMVQEHERGLGNWQAELAEWPGLFISAHGAASVLAEAAPGLSVDTARMRRNIDALQGLVFAEGAAMLLATHIGKPRAHALLEALSRRAVAEQVHLQPLTLAAIAADAALAANISGDAVRAVFDADAAALRASAGVAAQWADLRARALALDAQPAG